MPADTDGLRTSELENRRGRKVTLGSNRTPPPFQSLSGQRVCAVVRHGRLKQARFRSYDVDLAFGDLDPLGERAKMITR